MRISVTLMQMREFKLFISLEAWIGRLGPLDMYSCVFAQFILTARLQYQSHTHNPFNVLGVDNKSYTYPGEECTCTSSSFPTLLTRSITHTACTYLNSSINGSNILPTFFCIFWPHHHSFWFCWTLFDGMVYCHRQVCLLCPCVDHRLYI